MEQSKGVESCINIMSLLGLLFLNANVYSQQLPQPDNFIEKVTYDWDTENATWGDTIQWTKGIIENGERIKELEYALYDDSLKYYACKYRHIHAGQIDSTSNHWIYPDGSEQNNFRNHFFYQHGQLVKSDQIYWSYTSMSWQYDYVETWALDEYNRHKYRLTYYLNSGSLELEDSTVFTYTTFGQPETTITYQYEWNGWQPNFTEVISYDMDQRISEHTSWYRNWQGEQTPQDQTKYVYNSSSHLPDTFKLCHWSGTDWLGDVFYANEYNMKGNLVQQNIGPFGGAVAEYYLFDYDDLNRLITQDHFIKSGNGDIGDKRVVYIYGELAGVPVNEDNRIAVFPNPAHDQITVKLPGGYSDSHLEVISVDGKILLRGTVSGNNGLFQILLHHCPAGIYFLRFNHNGQFQSVRFVKE